MQHHRSVEDFWVPFQDFDIAAIYFMACDSAYVKLGSVQQDEGAMRDVYINCTDEEELGGYSLETVDETVSPDIHV